MNLRQIFLDVVDAFDRFWDENADKIVPILGIIGLIIVFALSIYFIYGLFEIFIECVQSNETVSGFVCRVRVT